MPRFVVVRLYAMLRRSFACTPIGAMSSARHLIHRRRAADVFAFVALAGAVVSCQIILGIDPDGRHDETADAAVDDASPEGASDSSVTQTTDASIGTDAAIAHEDACFGHVDCPSLIEPADLQLWLRGITGLNCGAGRVAVWSDQSGRKHDATAASFLTVQLSKPLTPQCGVDKIDGHDVVTFTAPAPTPSMTDGADSTDYVDETLAVDMNWIVGVDYTVFVVHQRALDSEFGLFAQDRTFADPCRLAGGEQQPQEAFELEYRRLPDAGNGVAFDQFCGGLGSGGGHSDLDTFQPHAARLDEVVFSASTGHRLYSNGALVVPASGSLGDTQPIARYSVTDAGLPGVVGRGADGLNIDTRYQGDIAEIIGYSRALSDDERTQIEGYLQRQWALVF